MSDSIALRLRQLLGNEAVERDASGLPRAVPDSTENAARVLSAAHEQGWRVRIEGRGGWLAADAPADLALSTQSLVRLTSVSPADLVASVEAGVPLDQLHRRLADDGMWFAVDPPGRPERSLGSVIATAASGPLRQGFGTIRDHILGLTVVTGDGRIVRAGGKVVKNVAGYDLGKLQIGGFGGFGLVTELNLRLRALPRADRTLIARASRDRLTNAGRAITEGRLALHALELFSPALAAESDWVLAARFLGTEEGVAAEVHRLPSVTEEITWQELPADRTAAFWHLAARATLGGAVTIRLGVLQPGLDDVLDLVRDVLGEGLVSAGAGTAGGIRWSGEAQPDALRSLRHQVAQQEIPMTLERAPWTLRRQVGHFGAYREGVGQLVDRLRGTFDPGALLSVALSGE